MPLTDPSHVRVSRPAPRGAAGAAPAARAVALTLLAACALVFLWGFLPGHAAAARAKDEGGRGKVVLFEDLTVRPGDVWSTVVVVGGDVVIAGTVEDTVVVVGGDLRVESTAEIGLAAWKDPGENAIVSVFGEVTVVPGAEVQGDVTSVLSDIPGALRTFTVERVLQPWRMGTPSGLAGGFVTFIVVAVLIAVVAPRQVAFVRDRVRDHFFSSLGWGVLGTIVGIPLSVVVLTVTVVGILVLAPWLAVVLPLTFLFGVVAVASWIGGGITRAWGRGRGALVPTTILGAVIISIVWFVPGLGSLVAFLACMVGFGATFTSIYEWRRQVGLRSREEAMRRTAAGHPPGQAPSPARPAGPEAGASSTEGAGRTEPPPD